MIKDIKRVYDTIMSLSMLIPVYVSIKAKKSPFLKKSKRYESIN